MAKAALRNAATRANAVATRPTSGTVANPATPATANTKPTNWANFNGATGSRSVTGPSRGATRRWKTKPYGSLGGPRTAPTTNTTACAARIPAAGRGVTADTSSVATSTAVVTHP